MINRNRMIALGILGYSSMTYASETANAYAIDNLFLFICAVLVLFMQAGFALLESGLNSAKNTVNILFKNISNFGYSTKLTYMCECYYMTVII